MAVVGSLGYADTPRDPGVHERSGQAPAGEGQEEVLRDLAQAQSSSSSSAAW